MKTVMFASIFAIFLLVISPVYLHAAEDENIMSDAFLTTLSPHIANAIAGHYGKVVQHALYDIEIISIERTKNGRTLSFDVVLKVYPYEKAHNYIGADTVTIEVLPSGVYVTDYKNEKFK